MRRHLAVLLAVPTAGCVLPPLQTYEGQPKPRMEIGIVKSIRDGGFLGQFSSYARRVSGEKLEFKDAGNSFTGYPTELQMEPGRYVILMKCNGGGGYGFPSVDFDVLPGVTYEISCESAALADQRCSNNTNPASIDFNAAQGMPGELPPCGPALARVKRDGSFREAPIYSPPSGGGGGGGYVYVPSGRGGGGGGRSSGGGGGSRTSSFMNGFMNGLSSGLANGSAPQSSGPIGSVRAFVSKRYPSDQPLPQKTAEK